MNFRFPTCSPGVFPGSLSDDSLQVSFRTSCRISVWAGLMLWNNSDLYLQNSILEILSHMTDSGICLIWRCWLHMTVFIIFPSVSLCQVTLHVYDWRIRSSAWCVMLKIHIHNELQLCISGIFPPVNVFCGEFAWFCKCWILFGIFIVIVMDLYGSLFMIYHLSSAGLYVLWTRKYTLVSRCFLTLLLEFSILVRGFAAIFRMSPFCRNYVWISLGMINRSMQFCSRKSWRRSVPLPFP